MFVYIIHILDVHLNIHDDTFSVLFLSHCRMFEFGPTQGFCIGSHPLLATRDGFVQAPLFQVSPTWTSQRGSLKVSGTQNNEISVEACWCHDSADEPKCFVMKLFPTGEYGCELHRYDMWKLTL